MTKLCEPDNLGVSDPIDLCLAFNVVHEVPDASALFSQIRAILKPAGRLLVAEPGGWHVSDKDFEATLSKASAARLKLIGRPRIRRSQSALLGLK